MNNRQLALLGLIIASLIWATVGVVTKLLLVAFDPIPLAFLRFLVAFLVVLPWMVAKWKKEISIHVQPLLIVSLLLAGNIFFFYFGINLTTANASMIIYTVTPVAVAIFSRLFIKESFTSQKIVGILTGLFGVITITFLPLLFKGETVTGNPEGNILVIIAMLCSTTYTIYSRYIIVAKKIQAFTVAAFSFLVIAVLFGIFTVITTHREFITPLLNSNNIVLLLYLGIMITVVTYVLYQFAIQHTSATTASLAGYIQPVFGIILNMMILGEKITAGFIVGSLLVFLGVFLTTNPAHHARNWLHNRRNRSK